MEDDVQRLEKFNRYYQKADISKIPYTRFIGIDGKTLEINRYVNSNTYKQILEVEKNKYRIRHYELTRGGVGCYLSHLTLYDLLLKDSSVEYYLIFEDDAAFDKDILQKITKYVNQAPKEWDLLNFGAIYEKGNNIYPFRKYSYFWGLNCYMINKKGASKMLKEYYKNLIYMQIDSTMSRMASENNLNIYGTIEKLTKHEKIGTNIQYPIKYSSDIDPFEI